MVITDEGRRRFLELRVNKVQADDLVLFLFSNPVIPGRKTKLADLKEVIGGGYTSKRLTGSGWTVGPMEASGRIVISYPVQLFTFTSIPSPNTVWGYAIRQGQVLLGSGFVVPPEKGKPRAMVVQIMGDECAVLPAFYEDPASEE